MASAVERVAVADRDATDLLTEYANELHDRGVGRPPERVETIPDEYAAPHGAFLVLYEDGEPVACGGIRSLGDGVAEVKRMYVRPAARGQGIGLRLLTELEREARALGYLRVRLDTAAPLHQAEALYRKAGYRDIPDYNGNSAAALWFEKELTPPAEQPGWLLWLALGTIYIVWGSTYLAIRVMVETIPPLMGAGARFLVAGLVFYAVLRVRKGADAVRFGRPQLLAAGAAGGLLLLGGNGLVSVGEKTVPSGLAALIIASVPLWIVLFRRLGNDRIPRLTFVGVFAGFVGVAILLLPGERPEGATVGGMALIVLAAASWATGSYYSRRWPLPGDVFVSTALQMICAGVLMLVLGAAIGEISNVHFGEFSTRSVAGWLFLVTFGSLAAFTAYVWLLKNAPISKVATYAYVNPVVAIFLGWALLSEQITSTILIGAALIVASVALVVTRESG